MAAANPPDQQPFTHHVAVLAFPFGSHASALLDVILRLATASPHVLFSFFTTSKANTSLLSKLSTLDNVKTHDVADGLPEAEGYVPSRNPEEPIGWFMKVAPGEFRRGVKEVEAATGLKIRCLVSDAFFWFPGEMAEEMKVFSVPVWTGGPRSLVLHVETDFIRQRVGNSGGGDQTLDFLPAFSRFQIPDLPPGIVTGNLESPIATMLHKTGQELPKATVIVVNSYVEVDPEIETVLKSRFQKVLNVGPMSLVSSSPSSPSVQDESGCLEWLDRQKPASVVYIAFGTIAMPPPQELAAFAQALIETKVPFLWSYKGDIEDVLPKEYGQSDLNGKIVPWAPQVQVLGHVSTGVFVTHGGWNSVLESIGGGVPMICRPFFGDQQLNSRTIVAVWEIGLELEGGVITKDGMIKALENILKHKEGKQMRDKLGVLKDLTEQAVGRNGSSTKAFNSLVEIVTK